MALDARDEAWQLGACPNWFHTYKHGVNLYQCDPCEIETDEPICFNCGEEARMTWNGKATPVVDYGYYD